MAEILAAPAPDPLADSRAWWKQLSRYHWYVFALCAMGWLFDTMDQKIFTTSRQPALQFFLPGAPPGVVNEYGGYVTAMFVLGWATGGIIFGIIGDRWGRAKTMALTIFIYAFFTGFSAIAQTWWQFGICRFLTGLGVGGEFAAGASLLAEVVPQAARAKALGMLQALSAIGNILGASLFGYIEPRFKWQGLYLIGAAPALLAVFVRIGMKEPEKWVQAKASAKAAQSRGEKVRMGGIREVFRHPQWRRNAIAGMCIAIAGMIGLWSIGFYLPELIRTVFPNTPKEMWPKIEAVAHADTLDTQSRALDVLNPEEKLKWTALAKSVGADVAENGALNSALAPDTRRDLGLVLDQSGFIAKGEILQQIGAFIGMFFFAYAASRYGRRPAFLASFLLAWASVIFIMTQFHKATDIYYMWPIVGFCMLLPFGGYAIYFPELFPTRIRTTGTGLCYNVGRYAVASGPILLNRLALFLKGKTSMHQFRVAAIIVSSCYIIGIVALIWAPETKDKPLPEDEIGFAH